MPRLMPSLFLLLLLLSFPTVSGAIGIGKPAPDFTLTDTNGISVSLSSFKGSVVILNFWSTTCPPCLAEFPSLEELYRELGKRGLVVVGVAVENDLPAVKKVISRQKLTFPILLDPDKEVYFDSYALFGLPISLIIDKQGNIVDRFIGEVVWTSPKIKEKIGKLL